MLTVVTGFCPFGYRQYGKRMLETFDRFWPRSAELVCYTHEPIPMPRGHNRLVDDVLPLRSFIARHKSSARAAGREPMTCWKSREREAGYSYRFDALKFCHQAMYPREVARDMDEGILIWLDGDTYTHRHVCQDFIETLLGTSDCAYLGRGDKHSEIGFLAFRLPGARPLLETYSDIYDSDAVFMLPEWHSAYVFDQARKQSSVTCRDLTPGGKGHVWFQSPLAAVMDHMKGDKRKIAGRSKEMTYA